MLEFIYLLTFLLLIFLSYTQFYPLARRYQSYRRERESLVKRFNRIWRSRKDMLIHFDWALSRGDPPKDVEQMGREIERMDNDMARIRQDIEELDRNRLGVMPMKSIKTFKH